jgi:hypothetical protein
MGSEDGGRKLGPEIEKGVSGRSGEGGRHTDDRRMAFGDVDVVHT